MKSWPSPDVPVVVVPLAPSTPAGESSLRLHDSASGRIGAVGPLVGEARMYVCGITPYDATHMGHANTYVAFDLVQRQWRDLGLDVTYVQNVTDVDDPLLERAMATGVDWVELAEDQTQLFREDMTALRVIAPTHYIGAVAAIGEVEELVEQLRAGGQVYQVDDVEYPDWYFRCAAQPGFGDVSGLDRDEMLAVFAERGGDPDRPGKRDALDCLVWRLERPGEPAWDSSLGRGRPGWHIECTAIALKRLGAEFDIQAGGSDLIFPHHEMCAVEGEAATGRPFARAYVHSGMVGLDGEKMSKSKGNLVLVSRLREAGVDPMAIRLALLGHHYRSDWMWTDADLSLGVERLQRWRAAVQRQVAQPAGAVISAVRAALRDDLDAPMALAAVDAWAEGSLVAGDDADAPGQVAVAVDALLGVLL